MSRRIIGLAALGLLALGGPAAAQTGDPLGLVAGGAIVPFWASPGNVTVLEVASPVGSNITGHIVFFTAACTRDESVPVPLTTNDVTIMAVNDQAVAFDGILALATTFDEISLAPGSQPIHVRAHWFNVAEDFARVVDPASIAHGENFALTYNAFRSGASFVAEREHGAAAHTLYLVCPGSAVTASVPASAGFPPPPAFAHSATTALIRGRVYDWEENPVRNIDTPCVCLTAVPLAALSPTYTLGATYTELVTYPGLFPPQEPAAFLGYRAIRFATPAGQVLDDFGRLANAAGASYGGLVVPPGLPTSR